jgi:hypothetical protein
MPAGSIYDVATGRPVCHSIDGRVAEPQENTAVLLDPLQRMMENVMAEGETALTELARRMNSRLTPSDVTFPADSHIPIFVRKILFRKNSEDQDRVNAFKANQDRAVMLAHMYQNLVKLGEFSHALAIEADQRMWQRNQQRPPELRGYTEVLRQFTDNAIASVLSEMMTMYPDMSMRSIARTTNK